MSTCCAWMLRDTYANPQTRLRCIHLMQDGLHDGSTAGAIVIGQKEMFQAVSEQLTKAGVTEDRILTNF